MNVTYQSILGFMKLYNKSIVHFGAEWCAPCKSLDKFLGNISIPHMQVDVDSEPDLVRELNITTVPVIWLASYNGRSIDYHFGFNNNIKTIIQDFAK